jgi:hypothetical protein
MFCFKTEECKSEKIDAAVWFFNYDLGSIEKVSNSFIAWLDEFNNLQ